MTDHHYGARSPPPTRRAAARPRAIRAKTERAQPASMTTMKENRSR